MEQRGRGRAGYRGSGRGRGGARRDSAAGETDAKVSQPPTALPRGPSLARPGRDEHEHCRAMLQFTDHPHIAPTAHVRGVASLRGRSGPSTPLAASNDAATSAAGDSAPLQGPSAAAARGARGGRRGARGGASSRGGAAGARAVGGGGPAAAAAAAALAGFSDVDVPQGFGFAQPRSSAPPAA
jgi:hypothetical protein